ASRLYITVSTVEQHLTRVYRKLNVNRRSDLPTWLLSGMGAAPVEGVNSSPRARKSSPTEPGTSGQPAPRHVPGAGEAAAADPSRHSRPASRTVPAAGLGVRPGRIGGVAPIRRAYRNDVPDSVPTWQEASCERGRQLEPGSQQSAGAAAHAL